MLGGQVFLPIVGQGFVEFAVLFLGNVVGVASPDGLGFVQLLIFDVLFLDGLFLLLVFIGFVLVLVFTDILNFGSVILLLLLVFHLFLNLVVRHLLIALLLNQQFDRIPDKLGMFLDHILDTFLF